MKRAHVGTDRDEGEIGNRQEIEGASKPGNADRRENGPAITLDQFIARMGGDDRFERSSTRPDVV